MIFYRSRKRIITEVKYHLEKEINGTCWAKLFKGWTNKKGSGHKSVDNRIKSLKDNGIITNEPLPDRPFDAAEGYRGYYRLNREVSKDEWKLILKGC